MRLIIGILLSMLLLSWSSCKKKNTEPDTPKLEISQSTINNLGGAASQTSIDISCTSSWIVQSDSQWCTPTVTNGSGSRTLKISISANSASSSRMATVTIESGELKKYLTITQLPLNVNMLSDYVYEIPIVFHTIYNDKSNINQHPTPGRLAEILASVNNQFKQQLSDNNMKIEFVLATIDPEGNKMTDAGIHRLFWTEPTIDCDTFMHDNSGKYKAFLWDPNQYINVMLYTFKQETGSKYITLGISHIPYSSSTHYLEGLTKVNAEYLSSESLKFPYCVSINNEYIYSNMPNTMIENTLAHELGHYLGLHHVFAEAADGNLNLCADTDYCTDTETYNIEAYRKKMNEEFQSLDTFEKWAKRTNCQGVEFVSRNIMDYWVGYRNEFTTQQKARVRHVLAYSPLIPGPKLTTNKNSKATNEPLDLPIVTKR